jgi:hypothetical protein
MSTWERRNVHPYFTPRTRISSKSVEDLNDRTRRKLSSDFFDVTQELKQQKSNSTRDNIKLCSAEEVT